MDTVGKLLRLSIIRHLALHPNEICKWRVCKGTVDCTLASALVAVVTLACPGGVPVPVDIGACDTLGDYTSFGIALALDGLKELVDEVLLVDMYTSVDGIDNSFVKELQASLIVPLVFNCLKFRASLSCLLCSDHQVVQRLNGWVCSTNNKAMIAGINC